MRTRKDGPAALLFLAPSLLGFSLFYAIPFAMGVYYSFTDRVRGSLRRTGQLSGAASLLRPWPSRNSFADRIYMLQHYMNNMFFSVDVQRLTAAATLMVGCIVALASALLAAYAFARLRFKGRESLFFVYVMTMLMPFLLVKEGDAVKKGQLLIEYENDEGAERLESERAALEELKLPLASLQDAYTDAVRNAEPEAESAARIALEGANAHIAAQAVEGLPSGAEAPDIRLANTGKGMLFELQVPVDLASGLNRDESLEVRTLGGESRSVQGNVKKSERLGRKCVFIL